jgi:nickel-dependent lactate racemase
MGQDYYLYLSQGKKKYFQLPPEWAASHFVEPEEGAPLRSIEQMTLEGFSKPTGTRPFKDLLSGAKNVAIIVDDGTRPTPVGDILGVVLSFLKENGFPRSNVVIVVALGTHEAMKRKELEMRLGSGVVSDYKVVQHNAWQGGRPS